MASIMRVRFTGTVVGQGHPILYQTFWRPGTAGGSTADATDVLARVRANLQACNVILSTGTTYVAQTEVDVLEDTDGTLTGTYTGSLPSNVVGTVAGDAASPALAWLIQARTANIVAGRFLKGRTYLAGISEGSMDSGGHPGPANISTVNAAFNGMLTGGSTASFPVIWHRPKPHTSGGVSDAVTAYAVYTGTLGIQRRRRF